MTTAYGSITITDLIDTATYIYYSETSETGDLYINNWHKKAMPTDKYICIYSGAPVDSTQPEYPTSEIFKTATISKFVGEDGEDGLSLEELIPIYYFDTNKIKPIAPSNKITTTEDVENEWTTIVPSYKDGGTYYICYQSTYSNGQISYSSVVEDNGIGKAIETAENLSTYTLTPSVSSINKFQEKEGISLSSNTIIFSLIERKNNSNIIKELNSSNSKITIILENPQIGAEETSWEVNKYIDYSEGKLSLKLGSLISDQSLSYTNIIIEQDVLIRCTFLQNTSEEVAYAIVPIRYGTSDDMAKFSLHAADITQAIGSSKLVFSSEGLKIINGGLTIWKHEEGASDEDDVRLFYYDQGQLYIEGTGSFSGDIYANDGYFQGTIDTTQGTIGGWKIDENGLYSAGLSVQLLKSGKIIAENIELGQNAVIKDHIILGNAMLCNPEKNDERKVLNVISKNSETSEITDLITLKDDGTLKIGKLEFDGSTSTISSGKNNIWSISPDGAIFTNINVSGKISTSIFETNKVQSIGGSMVFKTSVLIEKVEIEDGKLILITKDDEIDNQNGNYFYCIIDGKLGEELYQISSIESSEGEKKIKTNYSYSKQQLPSITQIIIIEKPSNKQTICIPVINSTNVSIGKIGQPRGFTISELDVTNNTVNTRVFLGDLRKLNLSGYGLYSDNAYLKGSLTTKMTGDKDKYAGLNTLTEFTDNNGQLIFWAGASSANITKENINSIPFRVYSNGKIYASDGFFKGKIEASTITGTDIYAATIHDTDGQSALTIDAEKTGGIVFISNKVNEEKEKIELLRINSKGLSMREYTFISIKDNNNIVFTPHEINTNEITINGKIKISNNNIAGVTGQFGNISFGTSSLSLRPTSSITGEALASGLVISKEEIESQSNFIIEKNLVLGAGKRIEYRRSSNNENTDYYDLYIR